MSFLKSLMKLFGVVTPAESMQHWEDNMTSEQLDDLERQGCDVTEYRRKLAERETGKAEKQRQLVEAIDLSKLNEFISIPRDTESSFVKDSATLNKLSSKETQALANTPIVYAAVVQAHHLLWEEKGVEYGNKSAVLVITTNEKHIHDQEWLLNVASGIQSLKGNSNVPEDNKKLIKDLQNDQSMFCHKVGASLTGDTEAWCATVTIEDQRKLPNNCLPPTKILPMLLLEEPKENRFIQLKLIPASYFTK